MGQIENSSLDGAKGPGRAKIFMSAPDTKSDALDKEFFIRATLAADPVEGYELLFRNYYEPLCSHAVRFVYNKEVAEDLVADVFFNLWNKKLHETITISFRAYLFTSVRNKCLTYLKWELDKQKTEELSEDPVSSALLPDRIMEFDELYLHIEKTINQFPPQCQRVFLMSRFEGKSYQEIAVGLGISSKAVEAHVSKGLNLLRKALENVLVLALTFIHLI